MNLLHLNYYFKKYSNTPIIENIILLESSVSGKISSNIFFLLKELLTDKYNVYSIYLAVSKIALKTTEELLYNYGLYNIRLIAIDSYTYLKILATAKFLFNDCAFPKYFIKKEKQIYTILWNDIPLTAIGNQNNKLRYAIGNQKRNLLMTNFICCPHNKIPNILDQAYTFSGLYKGKFIKIGNPRNKIFFNNSEKKDIRKYFHLENKKIYVYISYLFSSNKFYNPGPLLQTLDEILKDDEILYVQLDNISNTYNHIQSIPQYFDLYDFLSIADILITDYSSIMFDFVLSKKKIILFDPLNSSKDFYFNLQSFPFTKVTSEKNLISECRNNFIFTYENFSKEYNLFESENTAEKLLNYILFNKKTCTTISLPTNSNQNLLIYTGCLELNGIASSVKSLFSLMDLNKYNVYATYVEDTQKNDYYRVNELPTDVLLFPICDDFIYTISEFIAMKLAYKLNIYNKKINSILKNHYEREFKRFYGMVTFDKIIHYPGYREKIIDLYLHSSSKKAIYVHNDMEEEITTKKNQHFITLQNAYRKYDKVVVVSHAMIKPTINIGGNPDNIIEINNFFDQDKIINYSKLEIKYDDDTLSNISLNELKLILDSKEYKKFINIGRFSQEKGHIRLLDAFEKYYSKNKNCYLIIIGGYGKEYKSTVEYASALKSYKNIIIIKSMTNPYSILKKCDLFILSSTYEALGLVLLEASVLNIPSFSTDIPGPREFMIEHDGYLVDNSKEGILQGMYDYDNGKIKSFNFDVNEYNQKNINDFYNMFDKK